RVLMANTLAPKAVVDHDDPFADTRMSIGDHIEELRAHLFRAIYGLVIAVVFALWPIGEYAFAFITKPVEDQLQEFFDRQEKRNGAKFVEGQAKKMKPLEIDLVLDRKALIAVMKGEPVPKRPAVEPNPAGV